MINDCNLTKITATTGLIQIASEVSLTAHPFFEKRSYVVKKEQKRKANLLFLTNFGW